MAAEVANLAEHRSRAPTGETDAALLRAALLEQGKAVGDLHVAIAKLGADIDARLVGIEARFDELRQLLVSR
jgi:hypothetical protein